MHDFFSHLSRKVSTWAGQPLTFALATASVLVWLVTGPLFHYSNTWQLVINTATTIITFLMVFLIQNAQNREEVAVQLKLDELLKAVRGARTGLVDVEELTEEQLEALRQQFKKLAEKHAEDLPVLAAAGDAKRD